MSRRVLAAAALAIAAALLSGCEANTCEYGSEGSAADCNGRPAPTRAEANGWHAESLKARIDDFAAAGGADRPLDGVTVNYWGEMAFVAGEVTAYDVDGQPVEMDGILADGDPPFRLADIDPDALETVMKRSEELHPGYPFTEADLANEWPRVDGGRDITRHFLSWTVTVGKGSDYIYYETDAEGRILCERIGDSSECTPPRN